MIGVIIAFKNYRFEPGIMGMINSPFVGFKFFIEFYKDYEFWNVIRNTLLLSILKIIFTFPIPIVLALVFNEVNNLTIKRIVQTVSYLPYFISWVIVSSIMFSFFNSEDGLFNQVLVQIGLLKKPI
jgi:putative aldouronate transport system permease protein